MLVYLIVIEYKDLAIIVKSFQTFLDPFSASEGNPRLAPSFTNNYQFNLTDEGQPFFTIDSKTDDVIFSSIKQDNETAQIRQQEVNVENNSNWNFRLLLIKFYSKI